MVIYEVNLDVERSNAREFQTWLDKHISAMLEFDGFEKAFLFERPDESDPKTLCLTTHYFVTSNEHLEKYFKTHAEKMRADGIRHFGDLFKSSRRVFNLQKQYE